MLPQDYLDTLTLILNEMEHESLYGLRGWKKYVGSSRQDEVVITQELCTRLTKHGFTSMPDKYPESSAICDVVSVLANGTRIWIEAKLYYTMFFDDNDLNYENPRASYGSGHWKKQIGYLVSDCKSKLLRSLPNDTLIAGLLLGFEMKLSRGSNVSSAEVDRFVRSEMNAHLPGWSVHYLFGVDGEQRTLDYCPQHKFVTRPMLWTM